MLMTDNELYRSLGALTNRKEDWKESIPYVASLLDNQSLKITAKALWLLGEMGMNYPDMVRPFLEILQSLAENDPNPVVRIHSAGAIRITNKELNGD